MLIREEIEQREYDILSPYATHARESKGRAVWEEPCDIRTIFQRDRDRIIHSKSFRRLKNKTQVFLAPEDDHYRTRLTHTLEVSQIARTVSKALALNEDLTEAIALGHDLGHTPYGHSGEKVLDEVLREAGLPGFQHAEQSLRIVDLLERDGRGLNLSYEVRDGILMHGVPTVPETPEGRVVRLCDKIAYINHDIDDAIRAKVLTEEDIPDQYADVLGHSVKIRLNTLVHDLIMNSMDKNDITLSDEVGAAMMGLRAFMFDRVYTSPTVKREEQKAQEMLRVLYGYYLDHLERIPAVYRGLLDKGERKEQVVCDYIAGMTDPYAVQTYEELFVPQGWRESKVY
ncbi:MAG: deoxyguanosinetriphosphate triphosphohydrolase [Lachnospiraceae bacterium]|nr:deoxyguanosinetriphosphate triphosphohydrolase [Lachnospiraceae bacterium]